MENAIAIPQADQHGHLVHARQPDCADSSPSSESLSRAKLFLAYLGLINGGALRGEYHFRCLKDDSPAVTRTLSFSDPAQAERVFLDLDRLNQDNYNIFVLVNEGIGFNEHEITGTHCVFADWDAKGQVTTEEKLAEVRALKPSAIVHTLSLIHN